MVVSYCFGGGTMLCMEHALSNKKNMSKYIDTDSLRKEIGHRIDILEDMSIKCAKNDDAEMHAYYHGKAVSLQELLSFIDSLQQEQQEVDLEEEVKRYYSDNFAYISSDQPTLSILTNIAHYFTEWQKEQMLKEAVEGDYDCQYATPAVFLDKYLDGIKDGDKVRIIIVKEEK